MSVDLIGTVRLLHRVFEFLAGQTNEQLIDIAQGKRKIVLSGPEPTDAAVVPPQPRSAAPAGSAKASKTSAASSPASAEYAAAADELRGLQTVAERSAFLASLRWRGKKALKSDLVEVAAALGVEIGSGMRMSDIERKIVEHGLGAKKKLASLSNW